MPGFTATLFPVEVPHEPNRKPVSSPRHVKPSARILPDGEFRLCVARHGGDTQPVIVRARAACADDSFGIEIQHTGYALMINLAWPCFLGRACPRPTSTSSTSFPPESARST